MKGFQLAYIAVLLAVVLLAVVYLSQRNVILRQGYDIAKLRTDIEEISRSNMQIKGEVAAVLRPDRILAVLGEGSAAFVMPAEKKLLDPSAGVNREGYVRK